MSLSEFLFLTFYFCVLGVLSLYGSHRYKLAWLYFKHKRETRVPNGTLAQLPRVTIQLPLFNELYVVERLIESVCQIDYPRALLEIQVLDDSIDETCGLARATVDRFKKQGIDITYVHRTDRTGFKAGALENGLRTAKGEFIAVFDADFLPNADFLMRTVPFFAETNVGMVQVRWGHLNRDYSALTEAQSILLDGHFIIEHTARNRSGCFFNFNGTAGIWRRSAIVEAGGWQHDTLTEDLDLSYRAQLKGWQFVFLPEVVAPAEVPVDMNAYKAQQHRWAKGSIQTMRKLLPSILKADVPWKVKREAFFHLSNNLAYPLMIVLALLMPISMAMRIQHSWWSTALLDVPIFFAATASVTFFYLQTQRETGLGWFDSLKYLPFMLALGIGLSVNQSRAVIEALLQQQSEFARTPKTGSTGKNARAVRASYRGKRSWVPVIELVFGAYFTGAVWFAFDNGLYASLPFLMLFQSGFLYVGLASLLESRGSAARAAASVQPELVEGRTVRST